MKEVVSFIFFLFPALVWAGEYSRVDYKLSSIAKNISETTYEIVDKNIKYKQSDFENLNIKKGDIILSTRDGGFIGRVTSIMKAPENYYLETEPLSMEEVFEYLNAEYKGDLKTSQIKSFQTYYNGIEVSRSNMEKEFNIKINDAVLYDYDNNQNTKDDRITINGMLNFMGNIEWDIDIQQNSIKELKFIVNLAKKSDFDIKLSTPVRIPLPFSKEFKLIEYELMPLTVGPVVFTPIVSVVAGFNVGVAGKVIVNLKNSLKAKYGMLYSNDQWYGISQVQDKSFKGGLAFVGADGWLKGYIGPVFKLNFYNRVGPYIKGWGYLKTTSDLVNFKPVVIDWKLKGGLEARAGVNVKIFSWFVKDFEKDIARYEILINSGTIGNKPPREVPLPYLDEDYEIGFLTPQKVMLFKEGF